jgi:hypothetical protein
MVKKNKEPDKPQETVTEPKEEVTQEPGKTIERTRNGIKKTDNIGVANNDGNQVPYKRTEGDLKEVRNKKVNVKLRSGVIRNDH